MNPENKLPEDFKQKWVAALRSGEYKQGKYKLYRPETEEYCCLAVACKVAGVDPLRSAYGEYISWELGLVPYILRGSNAITDRLANMNDGFGEEGSKSFIEIADYIEENL